MALLKQGPLMTPTVLLLQEKKTKMSQIYEQACPNVYLFVFVQSMKPYLY